MSTKKSFLKGIVFKDENNTTDQQSKKVESNSQVTTTMSTVSVQGVADNKFIDLLEGIIEQNNLPGQDYFEFKQAIENMKAIAMDEKSKFQTVFTVLSLQGCSKQVLLTSLDKYVSIIQNEKKNFDLEMQNEFASKVQAKMNEIEAYKKDIESLTKKLQDLNTSVITLSQEAQTEEMRIKATEANFKASADVIISELISDKEKITNFIA